MDIEIPIKIAYTGLLLLCFQTGMFEVRFLLVHITIWKNQVLSSYLTYEDLFFHFYILACTLNPLLSPACTEAPVTWTNSYSSKYYIMYKRVIVFLTLIYPVIWLCCFSLLYYFFSTSYFHIDHLTCSSSVSSYKLHAALLGLPHGCVLNCH